MSRFFHDTKRELTAVQKARLALLVADLRRPEIAAQQIKTTLHRLVSTHERYKVGYCCLGRACEVADANGLKLRRARVPDGFNGEWETYNGARSTMPAPVFEFFGFDHDNGFTMHLPIGSSFGLYELNDEGTTFSQIADLIEHWAGL